MIEESAKVIAVEGDLAEVLCLRRSACGGCGEGDSCALSLIDRYFNRQPLALRLVNSVAARPGDEVVVGIPDGTLIRTAAIAYLLPLLMLLFGASCGIWLEALVMPGGSQALTLVGGLVGLVGGLRGSAAFSARQGRDQRFQPRLLRRVGATVAVPLPLRASDPSPP